MALLGYTANTTPADLNSQVGQIVVNLRNWAISAKDFVLWFNSLTLAEVQAEFGVDAPTATTLQTLMSYVSTVYGVYFGDVQQGGSGGTGAILFDFNNAFAALWGGR